MFISKSKLDHLNRTVAWLEKRLDREYGERYELQGKLDRLVAHLGLKEVTEPQVTKFVKK